MKHVSTATQPLPEPPANPARPATRTLVLLAFACDSQQGSEPGAGWAALEVGSSIFNRIILVTRSDKNSQLAEDIRRLNADVELIRLSTPFDTTGPLYLRYATWVIAASSWLRKRLSNQASISVIHHVTYASDWMFSPLALLPKMQTLRRRLVWGPVGGATYPSAEVLRRFPLRFRLEELKRRIATSTVRAMSLPLHRRVVDVAVAMNPDTASVLTRFARVETSPNIALNYEQLPASQHEREKVVVFAGRPLEWKGVRFLLEAYPLAVGGWTLELYGGTAEEFEKFGTIARRGIVFRGRVTREELLTRLGQVSAVALPSLHDSAGWIAAEAAAMGTRVLCLDLGGVSTMAGPAAVVIESRPAATLPLRIARALDEITSSTSLAATRDITHFSSSAYRKKLQDWYGHH